MLEWDETMLTDLETFLFIHGLKFSDFIEWRKKKEEGFYDVCED